MCHCWATSPTSGVDLTQTSCGVIKRRGAVILLGLPGIRCKSFPLHSSSTVDPVEVANCFSLLALAGVSLAFPTPYTELAAAQEELSYFYSFSFTLFLIRCICVFLTFNTHLLVLILETLKMLTCIALPCGFTFHWMISFC